MPYNIRVVSTYPPRRCGIGTFSRDLANALAHFTGEVGHIRVAAIDNGWGPYSIPVDLTIDQYNPDSWRKVTADIAKRARESVSATVLLLQHEYGLDPDKHGSDARGTNFVDIAEALHEQEILTLVYLHTVLHEPDPYQRKVLQDLGKHSDGLLVTTRSAVGILASEPYGIARAKLKHIDHGIRMQDPSEYDRLAIKRELGLEDQFVVATLGLRSPHKGLQYGIRAYARFLEESCTQAQRESMVYLVAGQCHPDFIRAKGGELYGEYQATIQGVLDDCKLKWCEVNELGTTDFAYYDVVFLDAFLEESILLKLYGAANVMVLPYLDMQQISSGILADTLGSGRVAIATKFMYALELLNPKNHDQEGVIIDPHARGVLVDPGEPSVEQMAQALDYVVFNSDERLEMEEHAHTRGHQMRWDNTAWQLLQYIEFIREKREIVTGRGMEFTRQKPSLYEKRNAE